MVNVGRPRAPIDAEGSGAPRAIVGAPVWVWVRFIIGRVVH